MLTKENMIEALFKEQQDIDTRINELTNMVNSLMKEREEAKLKAIDCGKGYSHEQ